MYSIRLLTEDPRTSLLGPFIGSTNQPKDYELKSAILKMEVNKAGVLDIVMPLNHKHYNKIQPLSSIIKVYNDDDIIWVGRALFPSEDFQRNRKWTCEGALAFLNDFWMEPHDYSSGGILAGDYLDLLIRNYRKNVFDTPQDMVCISHTYAARNTRIYPKVDVYEKYSKLVSNLIDALGGVLNIDYEAPILTLSWSDYTQTESKYEIRYGHNMTDVSKSINGANVFTIVRPLSKLQNGGVLSIPNETIVSDSGVYNYGRIEKVIYYDNITNQSELYALGYQDLMLGVLAISSIEVTAADIGINGKFGLIKVGDKTRIRSVPHDIDSVFPCLRVTHDLLNYENASYGFGLSRPKITSQIKGDKQWL